MDRPPPPDDSSVDRRTFFRRLLLRGLNKVEKTASKLETKFEKWTDTPDAATGAAKGAGGTKSMSTGGAMGAASVPAQAARPQNLQPQPLDQRTATGQSNGWSAMSRRLPPPGALPGRAFADACSRCGDCVAACPVTCIRLDADAPGTAGLPYILARQSACIVCESLACMHACPTGALKVVDEIEAIDMGIAMVNHASCLRSHQEEEPCEACVTICPMGATALGIDAAGRIEVRPGCIGCGLCEQTCPTEPTSIWVQPRA